MNFLRRLGDFFHRHFVPHHENSYRPNSLSRDVLVAAVTLTCVIEGFLVATLFIQSKPGDFTAAVIESAIISLTNNERAVQGVGQLSMNATLTLAAQAKAEDMARKGYFSHVSPEGDQPWKWFGEAGYDYAYAGENLAIRFYDSGDVVTAWMNSPGHRQNILKGTYQDIGIGIASGVYQGEQTTFIVQFFGTTKALVGVNSSPSIPVPSVASAPTSASVPEVKEASTEPIPPDVQSSKPLQTSVAKPVTKLAQVSKPAVNAPVTSVDVVNSPRISQTNVPSSFAKFIASPRTVALAMLGAIMAFLIIAIGFAMLSRIHIRPTDLILNGVAVAVFTLVIFGFNSYFLKGAALDTEPAAVIESLAPRL